MWQERQIYSVFCIHEVNVLIPPDAGCWLPVSVVVRGNIEDAGWSVIAGIMYSGTAWANGWGTCLRVLVAQVNGKPTYRAPRDVLVDWSKGGQ